MTNEMRSRALFFTILILFLGVGGYFLNALVLGESESKLPFSLKSIYLFFGIAAWLIYALLELAAPFIKDKVGYLFLFAVMIKLGLFMVIFFGKSSTESNIPMEGKLSMIISLFIFISVEGFATFKVLNSSVEQPK